jgi:hypothetical protein
MTIKAPISLKDRCRESFKCMIKLLVHFPSFRSASFDEVTLRKMPTSSPNPKAQWLRMPRLTTWKVPNTWASWVVIRARANRCRTLRMGQSSRNRAGDATEDLQEAQYIGDGTNVVK